MSIENNLIDKAKNNPEFLYISGSNLYGTNIESSDIDIRGFFIPTIDYILGIKNCNSVDLEGDHKIYPLHKFLQLLLEGDPQNVESLFIPFDKVKFLTTIGKQILSYKTDFLSNKIYSRIMGYSNGEWRKAMAIQIVPKKRAKTEVEILGELWNIFNDLDKEQKDKILYLLYKNREKEIISSISGLGKKRKEQVKNYGYCSKSASHAIRLVQEVQELMETGKITFPRYNASLLKDIRYGKIEKKEVEEIYIKSRESAENSRKKSKLPDSPNYSKVWTVYKDVITNYLKNDVHF